jgi:hypothetical protein
LEEAVDVSVANVVPHTLGGELHGVAVACLKPVLFRVGVTVSAATDGAADEADPDILGAATGGTLGRLRRGVAVATDWAGGVVPLDEAGGVEGVAADGGDDTTGALVEAFKAHGAGGHFGEGVGQGGNIGGVLDGDVADEEDGAEVWLEGVEALAMVEGVEGVGGILGGEFEECKES